MKRYPTSCCAQRRNATEPETSSKAYYQFASANCGGPLAATGSLELVHRYSENQARSDAEPTAFSGGLGEDRWLILVKTSFSGPRGREGSPSILEGVIGT